MALGHIKCACLLETPNHSMLLYKGNQTGRSLLHSHDERRAMILTTKRLVLREFEEEDWQAVLTYQSDPRYLRYYPWTSRSEQDARMYVQQLLAQREEEPRTKFQLTITLASNGQLIGNAGIRMNTPEASEADIGYELDGNAYEK